MNINYRNVFLALIAAILIAIPTAAALNHKSNEVNIEKSKSNQLQFDLKKRDSTLQKTINEKIQTEEQLKQKADEAEKLKQENERLNKELISKRERKAEEARIAAAQAAVSVQPAATSSGGSCRAAIAQTWPAHLQSGAITVMTHENRSEDPNAAGKINNDEHRSQDFGCFQINNYWHKAFFANNDWRDPVANARYAYSIYQGRGNWTAWYAVQGILW